MSDGHLSSRFHTEYSPFDHSIQLERGDAILALVWGY